MPKDNEFLKELKELMDKYDVTIKSCDAWYWSGGREILTPDGVRFSGPEVEILIVPNLTK